MPRPVRLRLLLLLVTASGSDELTEVKKQQLIRDGGLTPDAHLFANLERATIQHGVGAERTEHECLCEQRRDG
ncbi:hypothetical protein TcYC6_0037490 [Trypanosoma cruzi]|nr:hypothetical protein TcYC6_0037490 [Trypanosoma cruzi]